MRRAICLRPPWFPVVLGDLDFGGPDRGRVHTFGPQSSRDGVGTLGHLGDSGRHVAGPVCDRQRHPQHIRRRTGLPRPHNCDPWIHVGSVPLGRDSES